MQIGRAGFVGFLLCLMTMESLSKQVGDFSPIFIDATWSYSETNSNRISFGPASTFYDKWSGAITIRVLSEIRLTDTIKFTVQFRDSMYSRSHSLGTPTYQDSIAEFIFDVIDDGTNSLKVATPFYFAFLNQVFHQHLFPDSLVSVKNYGDKEVKMVNDGFAFYGEDIGLLNSWDGRNGSFNLNEFNGLKFSTMVRRKEQTKKGTHVSNLNGIKGRMINVLGRSVPENKKSKTWLRD